MCFSFWNSKTFYFCSCISQFPVHDIASACVLNILAVKVFIFALALLRMFICNFQPPVFRWVKREVELSL